jgi:predicted  nucleic acid-binding Zn ribbon protein
MSKAPNPNPRQENGDEFKQQESIKSQKEYVVFNHHGRSRYSKNRGNCPKCNKGKILCNKIFQT